MRLAFSTLGAPDWEWETVCERAAEYGFDGVDVRGLLDEIAIADRPEFGADLAATRDALDRTGLEVSAIGSSMGICEADRAADAVAEAERLLPVCDALDVEYVRVFGQGDADATPMEDLVATGRETMADVLALDGARDVRWLVETHDAWTSSADCRRLVDAVDDPNVGVLWDAAHTYRYGGESPAEALDELGDRVEHVHLKDAVHDPDHPDAMDDGWRYVLPGEGDVPLAETVDELDARGYGGWLAFEHEKRWHPGLEAPETANPAFVEWYRSL